MEEAIDALLHGDARAREIIWIAIQDYVLRRARLPIGALGDDDDERRNILLKVWVKLERDDYAIVRGWAARTTTCRDNASWWAFVRTLVRHTAIDYARLSPRNLARRGQPFRWARVEPTAPEDFPEPHAVSAEESRLASLSRCTVAELREFLQRLNHACAQRPRRPEPVDPPEPPFPPRPPRRRGTRE